MEERSARLVSRAGALAICVFALVGVGYGSCLAIFLVCPSIVPEPMFWSIGGDLLDSGTVGGSSFADTMDDVFRMSTMSLGYWMAATVVVIGIAIVITLLAGRALRALGALSASVQPPSVQSPSGENR
ncbi:hypothetical protein ACFVU2_11015 [Leifsonia sp. NPDC058194]|uniref:hypothetical protein n=1 Tax=Leifsonia sp. NPDC058194 TaxID=3346374 RepID=UPI0036DED49E